MSFVFRQSGQLQLLVCEPIERLGFKNAFSTRLGGVSPLPADALSLGNFSHDERANVIENRRRFLAALNARDWPMVTAKQIHSAHVRSVLDTEDARCEPVAGDALTANTEKVLLAIQTADCMPVLIADERTRAFAAVHAGWRGTLAGIVARTVERMQQMYDSHPADLHAAMGPAICAEVFEVGAEVLDAFHDKYDYAETLFLGIKPDGRPGGKSRLNLNRANAQQLIDAGVSADRIYDSGLCTWLRNDLFFSYRLERGAEKPVGRLMSVIGRAA
ncbi:MAG: peptidoglycan editing factor PgeF [Acidobacteriota bacterium]|nr:peptidoglycan editing factor PgeF [Acidobacteriota bacterium]